MSDTVSVGMAQRAFWNSDATQRWVTEQARIDRLMADVTEAALAAAAPMPGEIVLDVGCGTGTTTLRLADAVGPSGQVLGVDISEQQLGLARSALPLLARHEFSLCWTTRQPTTSLPRALTSALPGSV